jgi:hypothetical protein
LIDPKVEIPHLVNSLGLAIQYAEGYVSDAVRNHHQMSLRLFDELIDAGVCREQARGVLPQNLYTEYYGTCSLLNALKFISLRSHEGAQWGRGGNVGDFGGSLSCNNRGV